MTEKAKKRRDTAVVSAFFDWQKRFRESLLVHPAAQKNPRLFVLGYILSDMFDWQNFDCHPSRETLADKLGVTVTQVSTLTKELADKGFIQVKRRRNTSAVYVGKMPPEVTSSSLPANVTSRVTGNQEVKSSTLRKSSAVDFGKSSALVPNVVRNVGSNVGGGAHAPAAPSVFTVGDLDLLPDDTIIPPVTAKAARAEIIEYFITDVIADAGQSERVKQHARTSLGNLFDRGSLSKKRGYKTIDEINSSSDHGSDVDERSA
ncbi:helix-turn-helix domain-containing protein [Agrobacterium tumefaciens]|uniref:helix-turn-helix domain-containing protein n=1 Tax=Agrobacterium tumefaciens TaxID=358 RepID=UPI0021D11DDF|nr:helix-turn-helix domain-containing protein [Agrobacterium tumefaciens]UXS08201.1 helix-turn-helix domain-containing protein [Agrobacterium tumefaciens]UXS15564.1 helix-turn-helix domain-containing protein [Agrobacterium tumefaciens]UXT64233.1 helix-turn-helix domain-containing protein [Agrobacterium tumefaciens]